MMGIDPHYPTFSPHPFGKTRPPSPAPGEGKALSGSRRLCFSFSKKFRNECLKVGVEAGFVPGMEVLLGKGLYMVVRGVNSFHDFYQKLAKTKRIWLFFGFVPGFDWLVGMQLLRCAGAGTLCVYGSRVW
jgi:hypothetical protein